MRTFKSQKTFKYISVAVVLLVCTCILVLLSRQSYGTVRTEDVIPKLGQDPVYVELMANESMTFSYTAGSDCDVRALKVVLVNTDAAADADVSVNDASLDIIVTKGTSPDPVAETSALLSDIEAGKWSSIPVDLSMNKGEVYGLTFTAKGASPYFMKVAGYEPGVSFGFEVVKDDSVTYAELFYFSVPLVIILTALLILYFIFGKEFFVRAYVLISSDNLAKIWNVLFLVSLFVIISLKIYGEGYVNGVYISADSDGYLREAVNLANGYGFSYEGLAGYSSHFANWPIIYPAMIAFSMIVTNTGAYMASKYVAMLIVALIFATLLYEFKEKAWLYALAFTNAGFLTLCYYTWSEVPFIWFILMFALMLGRIVSSDRPFVREYIFLGVFGTAAFLTRYFGIYVWFVAGFYWLVLLIMFLRDKKTGGDISLYRPKLIGIFVSAAASSAVCFIYLIVNKMRNGYPTGVSRGTWWDDYAALTDDLINSLVVEIFNVFSLDVPSYISEMTVAHKALFVIGIALVLAIFIKLCLDTKGIMSRPAVLVLMAAFYYVMFIVVRYRSSMDTFYFRFFVPATVLLVIGIIDMLLNRQLLSKRFFMVFAAIISVITVASLTDIACKAANWSDENSYYDIITAQWDEAYKEIPRRSVIIWNDMDYRSSWYRPDVYTGEICMSDTWQDVCERYSASDHICMKTEDAKVVVQSGAYDPGLTDKLDEAVKLSPDSKYVVIANGY